jgi:hypothetical protein
MFSLGLSISICLINSVVSQGGYLYIKVSEDMLFTLFEFLMVFSKVVKYDYESTMN